MTMLFGSLALLATLAGAQPAQAEFVSPANLQSLCAGPDDVVYGITSDGRVWSLTHGARREVGSVPNERRGAWRIRSTGRALFAVSPAGEVFWRPRLGGAWHRVSLDVGVPFQLAANDGLLWLTAYYPTFGRQLVAFSDRSYRIVRFPIDGYAAFSGSKALSVDRQGSLRLADGLVKRVVEIAVPREWKALAGSLHPYQPLAMIDDQVLLAWRERLYVLRRGVVRALVGPSLAGGDGDRVTTAGSAAWLLLRSKGRLCVGRWMSGSLTQVALPDDLQTTGHGLRQRLLATGSGVVFACWRPEGGPLRAVVVTGAGSRLRLRRLPKLRTAPATLDSLVVAGRRLWYSGDCTGNVGLW